jgi:aerobic carbon-monoxide dehydrogenase medium subunit
MKPAPFDYLQPRTVDEALDALVKHGDEAKVLAGGQSLVPMLNMRLARPGVVVDINRVAGLADLTEKDGVLTVGALVRQSAVERWADRRAPLIADAVRAIGHAAIRNRGTVAGSVAHADPASELPALLGCLDGAVVARRKGGERVIRAADLFLAPLTTSLGLDELLTEVRFTLPPAQAGWGFAEVARRHGDFALVGAIALVWPGTNATLAGARLGFFGVGATPVVAKAAESILTGQEPTAERLREAARSAAASLSPESDLHATAEYRKEVAAVLAERTLVAAVGNGKNRP